MQQELFALSAEDITLQRQTADWVRAGSYAAYAQLLVQGTSFVAWPQRGSGAKGWAVLNWSPGDRGMRFAHILDVIEHPQSQADAADGQSPIRQLVKCELFDSIVPASAGQGSSSMQQQQQAMPMLDEDGLLVMCAKPLELCPGVHVHMIPAEQLCPVRLCVVPHMVRQDLWVALTRQPLDLFMTVVGCPLAG
jgi:hypothetical protein